MIHNKTEESLEQRPLSDLGGNSRNWGWDIWRGAWRKGWGEECSNILMVFAHITYIWWNLIFFSKNRGSEKVGPAPKTRFPTLRFYSGIISSVRNWDASVYFRAVRHRIGQFNFWRHLPLFNYLINKIK